MKVTLKWNKEVFENVEIDPSLGVLVLKSQVMSLTGVPIERQKLMAKGAWPGTLKDDADLTSLSIKEGQLITVMGSAEVITAPVEKVTFIEDMTDVQKAETGTVSPAGLENLGNTCYMNSTLQCLRYMPELREELQRVNPNNCDPVNKGFASLMASTFTMLDKSTASLPPIMFVNFLRTNFPMFAQRTERGGFMQQDAEEFYNVVTSTLTNVLSSGGSSLDKFLSFDVEDQLTCVECPEEPTVVTHQKAMKLVCNIDGGVGSKQPTDHMQQGIKLGLEGSVEKFSSILNRNALWNKKQSLASLPKYICVQFMRFFWKETPESMDHAGIKCKILRPVSFPETFDIYEFCSASIQDKLKINRQRADKLVEDALKKGASDSGVAMEVDTPAQEAVSESKSDDPQISFGEGIPSDFTGKYELMGVVTHKGRSADSGHYIAWVKQAPDSHVWWKFDDNVVSEVRYEEIMNLRGGGDWHTAYLNFYRLKQ